MLLAVDIGNSNVVFGLYQGTELLHTFRVATVLTRTEDEYGVLLRELLALRKLEWNVVEAAIIASVVPQLTDVLADAIRSAFAREPVVVGPGLKTGMPVLYENPREVGADRIVNAVAAYERVHGAVIVVDFGTATTFDCISEKGEYLGGVIVPGVRVGLDALLSIVQMPKGVPVGTLAIGKAGAANAALLAAEMLATTDTVLYERLAVWRKARTEEVLVQGLDNGDTA